MASEQLDAEGVFVVRGACAAPLCADLHAEITAGVQLVLTLPQTMAERLRPPSCRHILPMALSAADDVLDDPSHRSSFRFPLSPRAAAVIQALLSGAAGAALLAALGPDAELCELTTITSLPGADAQAMHADGNWGAALPRIVTAFVALHDVLDERAGPTRFCPSTHAPRCFADGVWRPPTEETAAEHSPAWYELRAGDAVLMDSTTWHCGGANTSEGSWRTLLSLAFVAPSAGGGPAAAAVVDDDSERRLRLGDLASSA